MTRLLSSHAESLFLLARRFERAESLARVIEVNALLQGVQDGQDTQFGQDTPLAPTGSGAWAWIVSLYKDDETFYEHFTSATPHAVGKFYICCKESPCSIHTSVRQARESVRSLSSLISPETSRQLAQFHEWLRALGEADFSYERLPQTCDAVKRYCYALQGIMEGSFYRDEAWTFFRLGLHVERASQTCKLLDVGFTRRAVGALDPDPDYEFRLWTTLLRSSSAYGAFRRLNPGSLDANAAARFLIFDTRLPRSLASCVSEIQRMINQLRTSFKLRNAAGAARLIETIAEGLEEAKRDPGLAVRLHEFNDWTESRLATLTGELSEAFFGGPAPAKPQAEKPASFDAASFGA